MFKYFSFLVITVTLLSCKKKEKIVEIEKEVLVYQESKYKWKRVKEFENTQNEYVRSAKKLKSGYIYFATNYADIIYDSINNKMSVSMALGSVRDDQLRPFITNEYKLELYDQAISIKANNNLPYYPLNGTGIFIYPASYDSTFRNLYLGNTFFQSEITGNDNTILLTYHSKSALVDIKFMALRLKYDHVALSYGMPYIAVEKCAIFHDPNFISSDRFIGAVGNNLLFMMGNTKNYLLNMQLDTVYLNDVYGFNDLFTYNNSAYSFAGANGNIGQDLGGQTCLIKSTDNGITWQQVTCGLQSAFRNLHYNQIGDKLIANASEQIWEVSIMDNSVIIKELANEGLTNKKIKAITMSNNRVFISTESGVFERPYTEFIDYKK